MEDHRGWTAAAVMGASLLVCVGASAQETPRRMGAALDTWSEPNPGVRYLRRTIDEPRIAIHALVVNTHHEGVSVVATPYAHRWGTVTDFAHRNDAVAAINGGFWGLFQRPAGIAAGGGEIWETCAPDPDFGHFEVRNDGRAFVRDAGQGEDERSLRRVVEAVSGRPIIVRNGEVDTVGLDLFATANLRQPRTAMGVSRDGRTVYLVVSDGRQNHSRGLTLYQLGRLLLELGAYRAINLDGGGSSAMYVRQAGGLVSSPARGRWVRALGLEEDETRRVRTRRGGQQEAYVRGVEREVMNQIAVIAPPPEGAEHLEDLDDPFGPAPRFEQAGFVPSNREPIRLGHAREYLLPAAWVGFPLFGFAFIAGFVRRLWRRVRRA